MRLDQIFQEHWAARFDELDKVVEEMKRKEKVAFNGPARIVFEAWMPFLHRPVVGDVEHLVQEGFAGVQVPVQPAAPRYTRLLHHPPPRYGDDPVV